jgi:hypothetical protein
MKTSPTFALAAALVLVPGLPASAEVQPLEIGDRERAIAEFGEDLAALQMLFPQTSAEYETMQAGTFGSFWSTVIGQATALKDKWDDDPHVDVSGFSVSLGFTPSIDVDFTFREVAE